jgi:CheY-like chemotaxis protein
VTSQLLDRKILTFSSANNKIWLIAERGIAFFITNYEGFIPQREGIMGHKLLLADDSITIQKVVELVLAGEGFDIKAANNGDEALSVLPSFQPDLVLADIAMPVMNGYQLCEKIKKNPTTKNIPVIMLSGAFEPIDEDLARNVGADDYIVKPFESQELINKVNSVLAKKSVAEEAPAEKGTAEPLETLVSEEEAPWEIEEIAAEPVAEEGLVAETLLEEELSFEEAFEPVEDAKVEMEPENATVETPVSEEVSPKPQVVQAALPQTELPSKEELTAIFKNAVDEKIASLVSSVDIRDVLLASIIPSIKDSAEKVLWEIAPELIEKLLKEMLQGVLVSLTKEVEKVLWETVPDLAETMIAKEIEKIKSEV